MNKIKNRLQTPINLELAEYLNAYIDGEMVKEFGFYRSYQYAIDYLLSEIERN